MANSPIKQIFFNIFSPALLVSGKQIVQTAFYPQLIAREAQLHIYVFYIAT